MITALLRHSAETDALEHRHGLFGLQIGEESLGGVGIGSGFHHGGRVDDLTAHLGGGLVHGGQAGAVRIGAVNDTGIHAGLADLGGDFLDVGTVGDDTGSSQSCLIQIIVSQDLLGVLTHGHITVAHAEQDILRLQVLGQCVKAVNALEDVETMDSGAILKAALKKLF